jgi:L-lactate dehydrogenase (cytochrome)
MAWSLEQVAEHNSSSSCWVIINHQVYDVTDFIPSHPGGAKIILKYAGRDATAAYEPIHARDAIEKNLDPSKHLGPVTAAAQESLVQSQASQIKTEDEIRIEKARKLIPRLNRMHNLRDIEEVARSVLSKRALAYYSGASDDLITHDENLRAFTRFFFNARVMRPVSVCDPATTVLGYPSAIPIFVSGSALAKLGHPQGEVNITIGCHKMNVIQMVSSNASLSPAEIIEAATPNQPLFFQLYKHKDDAIALERIRNVERLGYKALFLTVDAIVAGNREADIKSMWTEEDLTEEEDENGSLEMGGTAGNLVANDDRDMTWEKTIPWLRSVTKLPIVIKGVQCVEDCVLAAQAGVDGILLSNHGGRQLDYSLPPIEVLYRLRRQHPEVFEKLEVYIDGGIRRGTDVVKAVCLGARAVGLGRPFLYAQTAYGAAGVARAVYILHREILAAMRLIGASSIADLKPDMVERVDWQPLFNAAKL